MTTKFRVERHACKGRAAVASSRLSAGTLLLSTEACAAVSVTACNWCFAAAGASQLKRCGGCQQVKYCSRRCQLADWTRGGHGNECASWKKIPSGKASQTVLLVARLAAKMLQSGGQLSSDIEELRHHFNDHTPQQTASFEAMAQLVGLILTRSIFNAAALTFDAFMAKYERAIVELFCRVNCNAFTICDDVNAPMGIGMFPVAALLNHSCEPNCVVSFAAPQTLFIHVITPVDAGEELTISYVELFESTSKRRGALKASYFFDCGCERCLSAERNPEEDWVLDGFVCGSDSCTGEQSIMVINDCDSATCKSCGCEADTSVIRERLAQVASLEKDPPANSPQRWNHLQEIWRIVDQQLRCHPRSTQYATTARSMGNFLIDHAADLDDSAADGSLALTFLRKELKATRWVLPSLALPSRGLLLFQLAKLSAQTHRSEDAKLFVRQALAILSVAHGSDHCMVHAARAFLQELASK